MNTTEVYQLSYFSSHRDIDQDSVRIEHRQNFDMLAVNLSCGLFSGYYGLRWLYARCAESASINEGHGDVGLSTNLQIFIPANILTTTVATI